MKRGLWYKDNDCGYTDCVTKAGLYDREEALRYCFCENGRNGVYNVLAVPVRVALSGYSKVDFEESITKLRTLMRYVK